MHRDAANLINMFKRTINAVFVVLGYLSFVHKADCQPSFTVIPNNGNPIYVAEGARFLTLAWDYNADGRTVREVLLAYTTEGHEVIVAGKAPNDPLRIQSGIGYDGRVTFRGRATFAISRIVPSDSRIFKCRVVFTTFNPYDISRSNVEVVVVVRPAITLKSPTPVELDESSSTTLLCFATGIPKPTYTWKKGSHIVQENTDSNYTIASANKDHTGLYTCTATVTAPGVVQYSAVYSVDVKVRYKPTITTFTTGTPDNNVVQGTNVTISCSSNGYPLPSYAIKRNDTDVIMTHNVGVGKHRITNIRLSAEYDSYSCVAHNSKGNGPREVLKITVQVPPRFSGQTLPPTRQVKEENTAVNYSCVAEAKPAAKIQWVLNGKNLTNSPPYNISGSFQTIQGSKLFKTFSYLNIAKLTWRQYGNFSCVAYNEAGQVRQNTELEVRYKPEMVQLLSSDTTVCRGTSITFNCSADGNPSVFTYKLYENEVLLNDGSSSGMWYRTMSTGGVFNYNCVVKNIIGSATSASVAITVNVPSSIQQLQNKTLTEGGNVTLFCNASGMPSPSVWWIKDGGGQRTNWSELVFTNITRSEAGEYRCEASNLCGNDSKSAAIDVQYKPEMVQLLSSDTTVCLGTNITFNCSADGNPSVFTYQLYENEVPFNDGSSLGMWYRKMSTGGVFNYKCVVNNIIGKATSPSVAITVNVPSSIQQLQNKTLTEGGNVTLFCNASGMPSPSEWWIKVGNGQRTNRSELVFTNIARSEAGEYRCEASNLCGNDSKSAAIDVQYKPEMVRLLASEGAVCRNAFVRFICSANGNPLVFTYQLYENDVMVANGSSSGIWIRTMSTGGVFSYTCAASNIIGTANSRSVSVTVNVPSSIQPIHDEVQIEGGNVTLFCNASGIPSPSVHWIKVSGGQRFSANVLVLTNISRSEAGEYRCEASNRCGSDLEHVKIDVQYKPERTQLFASDATVCRGTNIIFNCSADGNPQVHAYQLYEDDIPVNNVVSSGVWSRTMSAEGVFNYRCVANNTIGTATIANVTVTVNAPASVEPLKNKIVNKADSFKFFCKVSGKLATSVFWTQVSTGLKHHNETWVITDIDVSDLGEYRCDATNMCGNDSDSMTILFEGGKCEAKCTDGKNCRLFGVYLCLCDKGKTGINCTETEALMRTVVVGFEFRNEEFKPQYENLEDIETLVFIEKVSKACIEEFEGSGLTEAKVAKLRKGSVIADVEMTFKDTVGESEIAALMKEATKDGKLGQIEVSQVSVGRAVNGFSTSAPSEPEKVNEDAIYGPIIAVLALTFISFIVYFIIKQRRDKRTDRQLEKPGGIQESHHNVGFETERNDADNANVPGPIPYMELSEVTDSQGRPEGAEGREETITVAVKMLKAHRDSST